MRYMPISWVGQAPSETAVRFPGRSGLENVVYASSMVQGDIPWELQKIYKQETTTTATSPGQEPSPLRNRKLTPTRRLQGPRGMNADWSSAKPRSHEEAAAQGAGCPEAGKGSNREAR